MTHIDFVILNSYSINIYLRFIKSTNLYVVKRKKFETAVFFPTIYPGILDVSFLNQENC